VPETQQAAQALDEAPISVFTRRTAPKCTQPKNYPAAYVVRF